VEIIDDHETAAQEIFPETAGLGVRKAPAAHLLGEQPGVIEKPFVDSFQVNAVVGHFEPGEAAEPAGQVVLGLRPVDGPHWPSAPPAAPGLPAVD